MKGALVVRKEMKSTRIYKFPISVFGNASGSYCTIGLRGSGSPIHSVLGKNVAKLILCFGITRVLLLLFCFS